MKPEHYILITTVPVLIYLFWPYRKVPYKGKDWKRLTDKQFNERKEYLDKKDSVFVLVIILWLMVVFAGLVVLT